MYSNSLHFKFTLLAMVFIMAFGYSGPLPSSHLKKVNKELKQLWPEKDVKIKPFLIDNANSQLAENIGIEEVYALVSDGNELGFMVYFKVASKFDVFDLALFYDTNLLIKSMKVLEYREDHGGEVGSSRWLKQFIGLGKDDAIRLNDDIQGISGATISCESATKGAKDITVFMNKLVKDE
jgi:hypothetical protein